MRATATLLAALAALPLGSAALAQAPVVAGAVPSAGTMLDVTAEGRTTRVPDVATVRAGVVSQAATAAAALADAARGMTRILATLKAAGVASRDVATANVSLEPQYRYADQQPPAVTGYRATGGVTIRFRDVSEAGAVIDALVAAGAGRIEGPSLSIDRPDAALDEARIDAVRRARARADLYARAAGLHVARIVAIAENGENAGGGDAPMPMMRALATKAATPIAAGEKDVTVTLSVRFLLD